MPVLKKDKAHKFMMLLGGMVIGHGVALLLLPLFTKFFTPEMFGIFSWYTYFTAFLSVPITLGYESQITNGKDEEDTYKLVNLVVYLSLFIGGIFTFTVVWPAYVAIDEIEGPFLLAVLTLVSACIANLLSASQFICVRDEKYKALSFSNFTNQGGRAGTQLAFGWALLSPLGMVIGDIVGRIIAVILMAYKSFSLSRILKFTSLSSMKDTMRNYRSDSLWYMGGTLVEMVITWFPFLAISALYGVKEGGITAMVIRLLLVPTGIIGKAIADLYHGSVNSKRDQRSAFGWSLPRYVLFLILIASTGLVLLGWFIFYLLGQPWILEYIPPDWRDLYGYALLLVPTILIQFTSQAFARYAIMEGLNRLKFVTYFLLFLSLIGLYVYAMIFPMSIEVMLMVYTAISMFWHVVYCVLNLMKCRVCED